MLAERLSRFMDEGWVNVVGGCCGTTPAHTRALAEAAARPASRDASRICSKTLVSGIEALEIDVDNRPVIVGERTNVLGSRKFKRLIAEGKFEAAAEIARSQVKNGAQVIDVCLQDPDRDETADVNAIPRARDEDGQGPPDDRLDGRARPRARARSGARASRS